MTKLSSALTVDGTAVVNAAVAHMRLWISSTKSMIGHLLGAAGAVEAAVGLMSLRTGRVHPTLNLDDPDVGFDLDFVPHEARERKLSAAMSNSFGFGGTNATLIFKRYGHGSPTSSLKL